MNYKDQSGFALVELVVIVVVVAALSFVALKVVNKSSGANNASTTQVVAQVSLPSKIQSKGDVSQSIKALDTTPINSKLDPNQFDSSITSLL